MPPPPRPTRPLADKGRHADIAALMAKVRADGGASLQTAER